METVISVCPKIQLCFSPWPSKLGAVAQISQSPSQSPFSMIWDSMLILLVGQWQVGT